jgi:hypothetical protein
MPNPSQQRVEHSQTGALRTLTRAKLHMLPGALAQVPATVSRRFASLWSPIEALAELLRPLPAGLLCFWAEQPRGHVLVGPRDGGYVPGPQQCGNRSLDCVAHVGLADLAADSSRPLLLVGHLLDHLLGCCGAADRAWLSEGGGISFRWQEVGRQVAELHSLGYGRSEMAQRDPRVYFAEGLAAWCRDRQALNVADPRLERLLARTVMSETYWAAEEDECAS